MFMGVHMQYSMTMAKPAAYEGSLDHRGRVTIRPEFRGKLGTRFIQILMPDGVHLYRIPDKPGSYGGRLRSTDDHSQMAYEQWEKDREETNERIRGHKPRSRPH